MYSAYNFKKERIPHTTSIIALTQDLSEIMNGMHASHRRCISKCDRGTVPVAIESIGYDEAAIEEFIAFHTSFAKSKGLTPANIDEVRCLIKNDQALLLKTLDAETGDTYNYFM